MQNEVISKELKSLRNTLAIKAAIKIVAYTLIAYLVSELLIDNILNDDLAEMTAQYLGRVIYNEIVAYKPVILFICAIVILIIISYLVIRKMNNSIVETIQAIDKMLKDPEKEIELSGNQALLQNRLNMIRMDLIKNQNEAREELEKKNNLMMYVAHDLKTPLTSVIGYLTLLTDEKNISEELKQKYLKIALSEAERLEDLTNEFFDITRYNIKDINLVKKEIDLSYLFDQLIEECFPMLESKHLKIEINKPNKIMYLGDGEKLARCFENLIKNAINYSYENTTIYINVKQIENNINIVFKNRCDKIPKYKLDKIFEQFYRVDKSRATSTGGAGLGLAITKQIIELHGGDIKVKNDDEFIEFEINFKTN